MNTLETMAGVGAKPLLYEGKSTVIQEGKGPESANRNVSSPDKFIGSAANDKVFAKALSYALSSYSPTILPKNTPRERFGSALDINNPEIKTQVLKDNLLANLSTMLTTLASSGSTTDELSLLKTEVIAGIESGFKKAIAQYSDATGREVDETVKIAQIKLVDSVNDIEVSTSAQNISNPPERNFDTAVLQLKDGDTVKISFAGNKLFENISDYRFTTEASNISVAISNQNTTSINTSLVDIVNKIDNVISLFYRSDIASKYDKALSQGVPEQLLVAPATKPDVGFYVNEVQKYKEIEQFNLGTKVKSPEIAQVRNYNTSLFESKKIAGEVFASENEYKQIINGIVNQLTDIQIPDLVGAINRIHSFNSKFL